jgi:DNA polymerase I
MRKIFKNKISSRILSKAYSHFNFSTKMAEKMSVPSIENFAMKNLSIPSVTIVRTREQARNVIEILKSKGNRFHAWDTETLDIDPKEQSPVNHGRIICSSCFAGPDIDFGNGPRLFIDNYAESEGVIDEFKSYFEDSKYLKVWHNYGFDRHIFNNHGIDVKGFGGDTLHMARMYDTSKMPNEFSLQKLSEIYHDELIKMRNHYLAYIRKNLSQEPGTSDASQKNQEFLEKINVYELFNEKQLKKIDMKSLFQFKKTLANGDEGKSFIMPDIEQLHTNSKFVHNWVTYSVLDAEVTYYLRDMFQLLLQSLPTKTYTHINPVGDKFKNNYDLYLNFWRPFGELMTDMERNGIKIDVEYLRKIQESAESDIKQAEQNFIRWVRSIQPEALEFNPGSTAQMQQLLFGPCKRRLSKEKAMKLKSRGAPRKIETSEDLTPDSNEELSEEDFIDKELNSNKNGNGKSQSQFNKSKNSENSTVKYSNVNNNETEVLPAERTFKVENIFKICKDGKSAPLKYRDMPIKGLGFKPLGFTEGGVPAIDQNIVKTMLKKEGNGKSYAYNQFIEKFPNNEIGANQFEEALRSYEKYKHVETLLKTFILPLQQAADSTGRIHCSLNFNTDTGRISARRPNLQNQPSHDKDIYKIRYAFQAEKGKKLIVADYGQLELRILANITECKSMIEAFKLGGDFHSRTALGMFPEIQESIDKGECVLEWDSSKGKSPVPLLKDKFAGHRKKAKTMNFSIAYGKSAIGFSKDWNCSLQEAEETVRKWYSNRKEAEAWQNKVKALAVDKAFTQTLIGRYRNLRKIIQEGRTFNHALRASINTPIQGGAADVVIAAMVKLHKNEKLKNLGFKILLQVHDEVILEGPEEHAEEALKLTIEDMESPFEFEFPVKLEVDAKIGNNWYESK